MNIFKRGNIPLYFCFGRCPDLAYKLWLKVKEYSRTAKALDASMKQTLQNSKDDIAVSAEELGRCNDLLENLTKEEELKKKEIEALEKDEVDALLEFDNAKTKLNLAQTMLKEARLEDTSLKGRITEAKVHKEREKMRVSERVRVVVRAGLSRVRLRLKLRLRFRVRVRVSERERE